MALCDDVRMTHDLGGGRDGEAAAWRLLCSCDVYYSVSVLFSFTLDWSCVLAWIYGKRVSIKCVAGGPQKFIEFFSVLTCDTKTAAEQQAVTVTCDKWGKKLPPGRQQTFFPRLCRLFCVMP